jgi:hypothetical protein
MKRAFVMVVLPLLIAGATVGAGILPASAGSKTATIEFGNDGTVARAANGDTVELFGAGAFTLQPKSTSGNAPSVTDAFGPLPRTFIHRNASGNVLANGTWELTTVLSYTSYGPATAEQEAEFGGLPPGSEGGKLMVKVALFVGGVHVHDGIITIVCLLGQPPKHAIETAFLLVQGAGLNFNEPVEEGNGNVFIRHS